MILLPGRRRPGSVCPTCRSPDSFSMLLVGERVALIGFASPTGASLGVAEATVRPVAAMDGREPVAYLERIAALALRDADDLAEPARAPRRHPLGAATDHSALLNGLSEFVNISSGQRPTAHSLTWPL